LTWACKVGIFEKHKPKLKSPDCSVYGYGFDSRQVQWRDFFTPQHPDRFWSPPSLLSNGYRGFFPRG